MSRTIRVDPNDDRPHALLARIIKLEQDVSDLQQLQLGIVDDEQTETNLKDGGH